MNLKAFLKDLLHTLLPELCMACDDVLLAQEDILCTMCRYHLPLTDFHLDAENETARQLLGKLDFQSAMSMLYFSKSSRAERLIHQLKYSNKPQIGIFLGRMYGLTLKDIAFQQSFDMIIPVPIHTKKLRQRGYNQAYQFVKGLSESLYIPAYENILERKVHSVSQIKKSRSERYDNVKGVFVVSKNSPSLKDKHILLVDDILTTGATICEAGSVLCTAGAKVSIVTIARA